MNTIFKSFGLLLISLFATITPLALAGEEGSLNITNETDATLFFVMDSGGHGDTEKTVSFKDEKAVKKKGFVLEPAKDGQPRKVVTFKVGALSKPTLRAYLVTKDENLGNPVASDSFAVPKLSSGNFDRKIKAIKKGNEFSYEWD